MAEREKRRKRYQMRRREEEDSGLGGGRKEEERGRRNGSKQADNFNAKATVDIFSGSGGRALQQQQGLKLN